MATVYKEFIIEKPPDQTWDAFRDVGSVHIRLLPGRVSNTQLFGSQRILTFPDGRETREWIITVDDRQRRLAYAVIQTGLPLSFHHATFEVFDAGNGASRVIWTTDLLPDTLAEEVRVRMEYGAIDMRRTIEGGARDQDQASL